MALRDVLLALSIVALWGLHFVIIRIGALEIPPLLLLSIRFTIVILVFLPFMRKLAFAQIQNVFAYSFFYLVLHLSTLFVGLRYIDSGTGGLIFQTQVPFAVLLGWLLLGERFGFKTFAGLTLAIGGAVMIVAQSAIGQASFLGGGLILLSALFWALGSIRMRGIEHVDFISMTGYSHILAYPFIVTLMMFFTPEPLNAIDQANWLPLSGVLAYQVILMSLCLYLWKGLINRNPVYLVSSFCLLQPVFAVIFGMIFLHESLSQQTLIGGAMAFAGVLIVTLRRAKKAEKSNNNAAQN